MISPSGAGVTSCTGGTGGGGSQGRTSATCAGAMTMSVNVGIAAASAIAGDGFGQRRDGVRICRQFDGGTVLVEQRIGAAQHVVSRAVIVVIARAGSSVPAHYCALLLRS